jgi:hypothetical protein
MEKSNLAPAVFPSFYESITSLREGRCCALQPNTAEQPQKRACEGRTRRAPFQAWAGDPNATGAWLVEPVVQETAEWQVSSLA